MNEKSAQAYFSESRHMRALKNQKFEIFFGDQKMLLHLEYFHNFCPKVSLLGTIGHQLGAYVIKIYKTTFIANKILKKIYFIHCAQIVCHFGSLRAQTCARFS